MTRLASLAAGLLLAGAILGACTASPAAPSPVVGPTASPSASPGASSTASDPVSVLASYGWTPSGEPRISTVEVPPASEMGPGGGSANFTHYLAASKSVGLDFTRFAGRTLELRTFELARDEAQGRIVRAHLLVVEGAVVGGWTSVEPEAPGIYPLDTPREDLLS